MTEADKPIAAEANAEASAEASAPRFSELFASMVNHELRNVLNAVSTAASLIEMRAESEKIGTPAQRIALSTARMERMLSQLVDFTRVELDGALVLIREPFELAEVMDALASELPEAMRDRVAIEQDGDTEGRWDRDRVTRLLSTLLSNAIEHGADGGRVRIAIRGDGAELVVVEVENAGEVPSETLEQLFVPKRRGGQRGSSGLGLGLYVARHVAEAHGGALEVRSEGGRTRFTLRLPVQPTPTARPSKP